MLNTEKTSFTCADAGRQKNRPGSLRADLVCGFTQKLVAAALGGGENQQHPFALPGQLWRGEAIGGVRQSPSGFSLRHLH